MAKVKGRWVFNAVLTDAGTEGSVTSGQTVSFTSNGGVFDRIIPIAGYQSVMTYSNIEYSYSVYTHSDGWVNEAFKVIDFDATEQEVSAEFYAWLAANASPEGSESGGGTEPGDDPEPELPTGEYYLIRKSTLDGIADAVREQTGKTAQMLGSEIEDEVRSIQGSGKVLPKYDGEVIIEGEPDSGGDGGGSAEFNIAYGDTAPSDTSKLWVKSIEPEAVSVTSAVVTAGGELVYGIASLPSTTRQDIAAAAVGTKVYLFGGYGEGKWRDTVSVFDTENNTIETLDVTIYGAYGISAAAVGTKIYLFGGYGDSTYKRYAGVFDTENNTYSVIGTKVFTYGAYGMAAAAVGTKVYLFGGCIGTNGYQSRIFVFDTESYLLSQLSAYLPMSAGHIAAAAVGTKIYLFGGRSSEAALDTINVFDTESNTIETLTTTLPVATNSMGVGAVGTKIYLFGGYGDSTIATAVRVFDTENNTIETSTETLRSDLYSAASETVGTKIYLFGGPDSRSIDAFNASMPLATNNMLIEASATKNRFNLLPNVELGVNNVYLGNADGNGERVDAYLHNGTEWVEV